jgi:hypothetical protein
MQAENWSTGAFLERTDRLARRLQVPLRELPEKIGLSNGTFFAYRSGKSRITKKSWSKLRSAEERAGLAEPEEPPPKVRVMIAEEDRFRARNPDEQSHVRHPHEPFESAFAPPPSADECRRYLESVLSAAGRDLGRIGWVLVELRDNFEEKRKRWLEQDRSKIH